MYNITSEVWQLHQIDDISHVANLGKKSKKNHFQKYQENDSRLSYGPIQIVEEILMLHQHFFIDDVTVHSLMTMPAFIS
jgi:hypothetical protein